MQKKFFEFKFELLKTTIQLTPNHGGVNLSNFWLTSVSRDVVRCVDWSPNVVRDVLGTRKENGFVLVGYLINCVNFLEPLRQVREHFVDSRGRIFLKLKFGVELPDETFFEDINASLQVSDGIEMTFTEIRN